MNEPFAGWLYWDEKDHDSQTRSIPAVYSQRRHNSEHFASVRSVMPGLCCSSSRSIRKISRAQSRPADVANAMRKLFSPNVIHRMRSDQQLFGWLSPIAELPKCKAVREKVTSHRASNKGYLPIGLRDYLQLLDWTGRQIRTDKRGAMPANLESIFERLGVSAELWVDCVLNFRRWLGSSVGPAKFMESAAETRCHIWAISISSTRRSFA